ncbi:MAG: serine protease [Clostridiales bacterium]|nr:serine protease [Clostridiales bacterium]
MTTVWKRALTLALACVMLLGIPGAVAENPRAAEIDELLSAQTDTSLMAAPLLEPVQKGLQSVVSVAVFLGEPAGKEYTLMDEMDGVASGTVVSPWGHVLTNSHVVQNGYFFAIYWDGKFTTAYLMEDDPDNDLAMLYAPGLKLPHAEIGNSDSLRIGDWAIVIGSPASHYFDRSVTIGVISGLNREIEGLPQEDAYGLDLTSTQLMIQTDAAINPGMSGGGLFNSLGQLVGVPALKIYELGDEQENPEAKKNDNPIDNVGLCVPIKSALPLIRRVLEAYDGLDVPPTPPEVQEFEGPSFGVMLYEIEPNFPPRENRSVPRGLLIEKVEKDSPAAKAGIKQGDILVEIDGNIIAGYDDLERVMPSLSAENPAMMKVYRVRGIMDIYFGMSKETYLQRSEYLDVVVNFE